MDAACLLLCDPGIGKGEFPESVKGNALHVAGRNNTVGIDIVTWDENPATCDLGDFLKSHCEKSKNEVLVDGENFAGIAHFPGDRGSSNHQRTHQHGASGRAALAALEIPIARTGTELIADQFVGIHA